jgi:hypothetical protein
MILAWKLDIRALSKTRVRNSRMLKRRLSILIKISLIGLIFGVSSYANAASPLELCRHNLELRILELEELGESFTLGEIEEEEFTAALKVIDARVDAQLRVCRNLSRSKSTLSIFPLDLDFQITLYIELHRLNRKYRAVREELLHGTERVD